MRKLRIFVYSILSFILLCGNCTGPDSDQPLLTAELPLHLEVHIDDAKISGSEVPEDLLGPVVWNFDEPQPGWRPAKGLLENVMAVEPVRVDDALRLPLTAEKHLVRSSYLAGAIYVDLPDWTLEDWAYVEIQARTQDHIRKVGLAFNYTQEDPSDGTLGLVGWISLPFYSSGNDAGPVIDGTVQTYRLSLDYPWIRRWEGPWTHLGIWFLSQENEEAVALDILSVSVIPKEFIYADMPAGVKTVECSKKNRHTLYTHAPGRIEYRVRIPQNGRLDVGLGVLREDIPVTFRVSAS